MGLRSVIKNALGTLLPNALVVSGTGFGSPGNPVALTFDDGPHAENTPRILDTLADEEIRATFFLTGSHCDRYPDLVRRIVEDGHEIANHGYSHLNAAEVTTREYVEDVVRGQLLLEELAGRPMAKIFRPPYGAVTVGAFIRLVGKGYRYVLWSVDSRDSFVGHREALEEHVGGCAIPEGAILLFHDDSEHTAAALPAIIAELRARGVSPARVSDVC